MERFELVCGHLAESFTLLHLVMIKKITKVDNGYKTKTFFFFCHLPTPKNTYCTRMNETSLQIEVSALQFTAVTVVMHN